ncbi:MAG: DUF3048 domain-containing protein [Candidatus Magasanikbacteria bacterium]
MKKNIKYLVVGLSVLLFVAVMAYWGWSKFNNKITWKTETYPPPVIYLSALDGMPVSSTEMINPSVVGVMIDNHPFSRPQSGLLAAKIIYEAPAEGGITRYFAIFDSTQNVEKVGPVRSARPYFIDWIQEYDGLYMHCGGSPEALTILKQGKVFDINEMTNGQYYWRDKNRYAPHDLYTNSENWDKVLVKYAEDKKIFVNAWKFGELTSSSLEMVKKISIEYAPGYIVGWNYDENQKNYLRYINDKTEGEGNVVLSAESIVVQYIKSQIVDDYGRREITTSGQGDMRLLRDGIMVRGIWKQENGRTRFYDVGGQELNLKPGKIWIQIVPKEINTKIST